MSEAKKVKKSYLEQLADIEEAKKQLEATRLEELEPVITQMKADIAAYKITAEQLGFVLVAPTPPPAQTPAKSTKPANKPQKTEYDEDGNSIKYLADGITRRPFVFFNPASKEKAYGLGTKPGWLKELIASGADASTYTIKPA